MYTQIHRYINSLRTSATDWKPSLGKTQIIRTCSTQQPDFPVSINPRCKSKCLWKKGNPGTSSPGVAGALPRAVPVVKECPEQWTPTLRATFYMLLFTWTSLLNLNPNHDVFFVWSGYLKQVEAAQRSSSAAGTPKCFRRTASHFGETFPPFHGSQRTSWTNSHISSLKPNQLCCHTQRWFCLERSLAKSGAATA